MLSTIVRMRRKLKIKQYYQEKHFKVKNMRIFYFQNVILKILDVVSSLQGLILYGVTYSYIHTYIQYVWNKMRTLATGHNL